MKRIGLLIGGLVLITILAGAAFAAARMLITPDRVEARSPGGGQERVIVLVTDDGSGPVSLTITIEPAPELPDRPPEGAGIFVRREDNSFVVGTGNIEVDVEVDGATGQREVITNHSGPEIEALVGPDTIIYRDETRIEVDPAARESGQKRVQQVVRRVDSLDEIGQSSEIQFWGRRQGERIVAEVLVYRQED